MGDVESENLIDAAAEAVEPALLDQIQSQPAEAEAVLVIAEIDPEDGAQQGIAEAGSVGVALLQAEGCHPDDDQAKQVRIRELGRRSEHGQHVDGRAPVGIAHHRQVQQGLDRSELEPLP